MFVTVRFGLFRRRCRRLRARRRRRARRGGPRRRDRPPSRHGDGRRRRRRRRRSPHLEHDLHVVRGAASAYSPVQVVAGRRRDEVVVVAGEELQPSRLRRERPERYREVHQLVRFVADGDDARVRVRYPTRFVFVFGHVVDDVLLHLFVSRARDVHRTDQVHLVVLELEVVAIHVDDVVGVVDAKYGVRGVPVYRVELGAARNRCRYETV